jgi:hypothetical protein
MDDEHIVGPGLAAALIAAFFIAYGVFIAVVLYGR